jgi:hypothetical protein
MGGMGGNSVGGVGRHAIIQIIDSCPSVNAWNYCKTDIPANQRCESSTTNQLDIDMNAYEQLTGQPYGVSSLISFPTLKKRQLSDIVWTESYDCDHALGMPMICATITTMLS